MDGLQNAFVTNEGLMTHIYVAGEDTLVEQRDLTSNHALLPLHDSPRVHSPCEAERLVPTNAPCPSQHDNAVFRAAGCNQTSSSFTKSILHQPPFFMHTRRQFFVFSVVITAVMNETCGRGNDGGSNSQKRN